jgi:Right handed beta helix region
VPFKTDFRNKIGHKRTHALQQNPSDLTGHRVALRSSELPPKGAALTCRRFAVHTRIALALLATAFACSLFAAPAQALRARVFVASYGTDSGTCSFSAPCRSLNFAYNAVSAGGEITMIDSAGFEPLTINKSLTLSSPTGVEAGIAVPSGGTGIVINAGTNDTISLRGLTLEGAGVGTTGIVFVSGKSLVIDNCVVHNFQSSGIALAPSTSATIAVSHTLVAENGAHGIYLQPSGTNHVSAVFNHAEVYHNGQQGIGIYVNAMSDGSVMRAMIVDSVAGSNGQAGFYFLQDQMNVNAEIDIFRSTTLANGTFGVVADTNANVYVSQSNLQDGWQQLSTSCVYSYGDNYTGSVPPPDSGGCSSLLVKK